MISTSSRSQDPFATTRWSVVMHLAASQTEHARDALTELAQRYWYPVYAYVRRCGHPPPIAQDIARSFLVYLLQLFRDGQSPSARGHFRTWLLDRLNAFLAADWRATADADANAEFPPPPEDLETRYGNDHTGTGTPEQTYQRSFALEVLARAFRRLRSEAGKTDRLDMYEALEPYIGAEPLPGVYDEIARRLHTRPLALVVALKRLRQRFRELVGEELADTVSSADELLVEQQALHDALRG